MIRRRLVGGVVAVAALGIVLGSVFTLFTLEDRLVANLDREFRDGRLVEEVRDALRRPQPFERPGPRIDPVQRVAVLLIDADGSIEASSPAGPATDPLPLPDAADMAPSDGIRTVDAVLGSLRYRATAVRLQQDRVAVVAVPMTTVDETMRDARRILAVTGALAIAAIAGLSWIVIRRAFAPIDTMIGTADRIAAGDLSERTGVADDGTEVGRLGGALDTMLDRIQEAVDAKTASEERMRRFVDDASHELRTPLTSVRGYAELYRQGGDDSESVATSMARIEAEATRMSRLVEEMLLLARLDRSPESVSTEVDVADLVGHAVDAVRVVDGNRTYDLDMTSENTIITGDPDQLRRVLDNLLANARTHTPEGTAVHVSLGNDGDVVVIEVSDDGPGISQSQRERVFDRFWRSARTDQNPVPGTGLGLAIVQSIVLAHGGRIEVGAGSSGGASFTVHLPRSPSRPQEHLS